MKDEKVDVLDELANKTGEVLLKSEVHKKSLWHGAAHLWVYNSKNEVLLQRRHPDKLIWPNIWDVSAAGHIATGETPLEAILKEAKEELSIDIKPAQLTFAGIMSTNQPMQPGEWRHRVFCWTYLAKLDIDLESLALEEGETSEVRWTVLDEFETQINDSKVLHKDYSPENKHIYDFAIQMIKNLEDQE